MDFFTIKERSSKKGSRELYPDFRVCRSKDLMVRGKSFYAIWDEQNGMWSQDEYEVQRIVDEALAKRRGELGETEDSIRVLYMRDWTTGSWNSYRNYISKISDNYHQLDAQLTFADTPVTKQDYVSRRLPYSLAEGNHDAWDEIVGTLYMPEERQKIEWAIGAVVSGDSREIQKFMVFYGDPGYGKGTILSIIKKLFGDYVASFEADELTSNTSSFPLEQFRTNPLVAIQFDGELSHIAKNTKLNSLVSHEPMLMKEKFKSSYDFTPHCFLFLASNNPVQITNAKSGIIRRLIDVSPSMQKIPTKRYFQLMNQVEFELGAIAKHCLDIYHEMGKHYYDGYKPIDMMYKTDPFYNFVDNNFLIFARDDGISLKNAYELYKNYCENSGINRMAMYKFREELKNYFDGFDILARVDGQQVRSWFSGFKRDKFEISKSGNESDSAVESGGTGAGHGKDLDGSDGEPVRFDIPDWLRLSLSVSVLDTILSMQKAQYATEEGKPERKWTETETRLRDIQTEKTHYVEVPQNHIVIDFDMKDDSGKKSLDICLKEAAKWKATYAEVSKGGQGLHLHYIYDGDISKVARVFAPGIEIKRVADNGTLLKIRRRVSRCNDIPIAHLSSGLPLKEAKKTINFDTVRSEKGLRDLIERNLRKEIHPGTKPSIDFIEKILDDAYASGLRYDVSDMRPDILDFAVHSSHQAEYCVTRVAKMKFKSEDISEAVLDYPDERLVFFDIEVFPNLVLVNWKFAGDDQCQRMINPKPKDIEMLMKYKLIGFNCRRYDNHILYAIYIGKTIPEIYDISQGIISGSKNATFGEAYNISYTDVYDFCATKQSLKKWEIELGIHHQELGLPWDKPVPEEQWMKVAEYCDNDVFATEAVFNARQADWTARQILADLAGMTVNDTTNSLSARIIFGGERKPQGEFNYRFMGNTDQPLHIPEEAVILGCDEEYTAFTADGKPVFPGYRFDHGKSIYREEEVGEGGYVYAEPGIHRDVALLDIASMHPSSIVAERLFGGYTDHFRDILEARICIKHKDYEAAKNLFGGRMAAYLDDPAQAKALAGALKIAINSVYGLTSAKFDNAFRDIRNIDNIVAKRGALFMVNLKYEVQKRGYTVAHIKTDSIKIPNATPEIIRFVMEYGKMYGYTFEHEATYDRMCLVNDAVYIARYSEETFNEHPGEWTATGTQFQVPYIFKTLFSKEPIRFSDLCETKSCTTALYLDMNEGYDDVGPLEKELDKLKSNIRKAAKDNERNPAELKEYAEMQELYEILPIDIADKVYAWMARIEELKPMIAKGHNYIFIGKVGLFCPVKEGHGGGLLMREKDGKYYAVGGTTGYRWLEAESCTGDLSALVDMNYYNELAQDAVDAINQYGDFDDFVDISGCSNRGLPWLHEPICGEMTYENCLDCPHWRINLDRNFEGTVDEYYSCDKM